MTVIRGLRHIAAYPIRDNDGQPAWQGIIVVEPDDYRWRCPHTHTDHEDAVLCAAVQEPDTPR
jgi:hypothetical protein